MRDVDSLPNKEKKNIRSKFLKSEFLVKNLSLIISKFRGDNEDSDKLVNEIIPNIFYSYEGIRQLYEGLTEDNRYLYDKLKSNFVDHVFFYLCKYYINDIDDGDNNFAAVKESFYKNMGIFYDDLYNNFIVDKYCVRKSSLYNYYKIKKISDEDTVCYIHTNDIPGIVKDLLEVDFDKSPVIEYNFIGYDYVYCITTEDLKKKSHKLRITRYFVGELLKLISNNYLKISIDESSSQNKCVLAECKVQELDKENKNDSIYNSESIETDDDGFSVI